MIKKITINRTFTAIFIFGLIGCLLFGCRNKPKPISHREQFEKAYDANVKALMTLRPDMDSVTAGKIVRPSMTKLYEIDSTFVFKTGEDYKAFVKENEQVFKEERALYEEFDTLKNK